MFLPFLAKKTPIFAYSLCIFSVIVNEYFQTFDDALTLWHHSDVIRRRVVLFLYQWKEETHSYTLVATIRVWGVWYRKSRGVSTIPSGGRVTKKGSGERELNDLVHKRVVWHTGKVLVCGAVGPRFNSRQGQGNLLGLFCSESGWHTTLVARRVGLVLEQFPFTNAVSQWLYVNLVCRFHTLLGRFLRALRFPPTPENRNPFIFLVNCFWSLVMCIKPACLPEV